MPADGPSPMYAHKTQVVMVGRGVIVGGIWLNTVMESETSDVISSDNRPNAQ